MVNITIIHGLVAVALLFHLGSIEAKPQQDSSDQQQPTNISSGDVAAVAGATDEAEEQTLAPSVVCFSQFLNELYRETMPREMRRQVAQRAIKAAKETSGYFQNVRNLIDRSLGQENELVYGFSGARGISKFNRAVRRYPEALQQIQKIMALTEAETAAAKVTGTPRNAGQPDEIACQD